MFDKLPLKIHLNPCTGYLFLLDVFVTSRLHTSLYSTELSNWSLFFSKANASSAIKAPLSPERENLYRYKEMHLEGHSREKSCTVRVKRTN